MRRLPAPIERLSSLAAPLLTIPLRAPRAEEREAQREGSSRSGAPPPKREEAQEGGFDR